MSKRLTQDEFVQKVNNKYDGKFEVVGDYVNAKTPVQIKHNDCGTIFPRVPNKMTAKGKIALAQFVTDIKQRNH